MTTAANAIQQIVGRERRERVSQIAWCGGGCFDSRRRVNSTVRQLSYEIVLGRESGKGFAFRERAKKEELL